jgi:hypothetical protein
MFCCKPGLEHVPKPQRDVGILGGVWRCLVQRHEVERHLGFAGAGDLLERDGLQTEMFFGQLVHAVPVQAGVQRVGQQHGVVNRSDVYAEAGKHRQIVLEVLADLQDAGVFEHRLECGQHVGFRQLLQVAAAKVQPIRCAVAGGDVARLAGLDRQRDTA